MQIDGALFVSLFIIGMCHHAGVRCYRMLSAGARLAPALVQHGCEPQYAVR